MTSNHQGPVEVVEPGQRSMVPAVTKTITKLSRRTGALFLPLLTLLAAIVGFVEAVRRGVTDLGLILSFLVVLVVAGLVLHMFGSLIKHGLGWMISGQKIQEKLIENGLVGSKGTPVIDSTARPMETMLKDLSQVAEESDAAAARAEAMRQLSEGKK